MILRPIMPAPSAFSSSTEAVFRSVPGPAGAGWILGRSRRCLCRCDGNRRTVTSAPEAAWARLVNCGGREEPLTRQEPVLQPQGAEQLSFRPEAEG